MASHNPLSAASLFSVKGWVAVGKSNTMFPDHYAYSDTDKCLVTGGGTGIGLSKLLTSKLLLTGHTDNTTIVAAKALATNGARVYITGRRKEVLETSAKTHGSPDKLGNSGGALIPLVMDVNSKESIKTVVQEVTKKEGYLNVYVI
jgi:hypothetical protein